MSLQRRLILVLLICAPVVWALALLVSAHRARIEVNELYDTELVRLAREVQSSLNSLRLGEPPSAGSTPMPTPSQGDADLADMAIVVWDATGKPLLNDREGARLPLLNGQDGFTDVVISDEPWRVYHQHSQDQRWLVAAGQRLHERDEVVWNLLGGQLLPWLLVLPLLMAAMVWGIRRAMAPLKDISDELTHRGADDLHPIRVSTPPAELQPLLTAMNGLFGRIDALLARERQFTADAAHELRTPLAVLRAQWDTLTLATDPAQRQQAQTKLGAGLDRLDRLVTQMLQMSRLDSTDHLPRRQDIHWPELVEQAMEDVMHTAERRHIDLGCTWPASGQAPFPLSGDPVLMAVLLRNLLDNAVRYAPQGSTVELALSDTQVCVTNACTPGTALTMSNWGQRFSRSDGQAESGSGLGISIAQRVAQLHGLQLAFSASPSGAGIQATLTRP